MSLLLIALAWADHPGGGAAGGAPLSPFVSGLLWAGIAAVAVLIVFAVIAILTRPRDRGDRQDGDT